MLNRKLFNELLTFCLIGVALLIVDFGAYRFLFSINLPIEISKGFAYVLGTLSSFYLNKKLTFKTKYSHSNLTKFITLYIFSFMVNILTNSIALHLGMNFILAYSIALIIAVAINFIGQKFWVFK